MNAKCTVIAALLATSCLTAFAQSSKESCIRAVQVKVAACQKNIPANPAPKDPKNPTSSEKSAMQAHTDAWKRCNELSKEALTCK